MTRNNWPTVQNYLDRKLFTGPSRSNTVIPVMRQTINAYAVVGCQKATHECVIVLRDVFTPAKSSRQLGALKSVDLYVVFINIAHQIQESLEGRTP